MVLEIGRELSVAFQVRGILTRVCTRLETGFESVGATGFEPATFRPPGRAGSGVYMPRSPSLSQSGSLNCDAARGGARGGARRGRLRPVALRGSGARADARGAHHGPVRAVGPANDPRLTAALQRRGRAAADAATRLRAAPAPLEHDRPAHGEGGDWIEPTGARRSTAWSRWRWRWSGRSGVRVLGWL
jgi:hypothetical protein